MTIRRPTTADDRRSRRPTAADRRSWRRPRSRRVDERRRGRRGRRPRSSVDDGDARRRRRADEDDDEAEPTSRRASPWTAPGPVVRRAHPVGLREEGQGQPRGPHPVHEHGGQDLRGRHPHGGRRRVQGRPQADRPAQGLPRLPARALRDGRRVWYVHPQHPRRHRLRRPGPPRPEADAAQPARGRHLPVRQGRRGRGAPRTQAQAGVRGGRERPGQGRPVRRLLRLRSPRSTPTT